MMHLTELVRTSFISATASVDQLKLAGYEALRVSHNICLFLLYNTFIKRTTVYCMSWLF